MDAAVEAAMAIALGPSVAKYVGVACRSPSPSFPNPICNHDGMLTRRHLVPCSIDSPSG